ncbi:MAG: DcrB-related protein [Candidatus Micrarchaeota archaeon]
MGGNIVIIAALFVSIFIVGCTEQGKPPATREFSYDPPEGWVGKKDAESIKYAAPGGVFMEVIILQEPIPAGMAPDQYLKASEAQMSTIDKSYKLLSKKMRTINGYEAEEAIFTLMMEQNFIKTKQLTFIRDKTAYIISFAGLAVNYDVYDGKFEKSLGSLGLP